MNLKTTEDGRVTILALDGDLVIGEPESIFKRTVTRLIEEGKVTPVVGRTFALPEASEAVRLLGEGHSTGKIVVTI